MESELARNTAQLHAVLNDYEASIEELHTTREEVHAANEELQVATEELTEDRDQLRRSLSEYSSENESLSRRVKDTLALNEELIRLLDMLDIPVLQLGADFRLRLFTAAAASVWHLLPSDLGRHIGDLTARLELPQIEPLCQKAIVDLAPRSAQVCDFSGRPMKLLVRPFAGRQNRVVRIAVMMVPLYFDIVQSRAPREVSVLETLESARPRIQAALGGPTEVEISCGEPSLNVLADPALFEGVLVRSALAAERTVNGPARVSIASRPLDSSESDGHMIPAVPPGRYVAISIVAKALNGSNGSGGQLPHAMQVPESAIRELGAFYRVEYSPGFDSRLVLYLAKS